MRKIILFFMLFVAITFAQSKEPKSLTLKSNRLVTINDTYNKQVYKVQSSIVIGPEKIIDETANISWNVSVIDMKEGDYLLSTVFSGTSNFGEECILRLYQVNSKLGILLIEYNEYIIYYEIYDCSFNF